MTLSAPRPRIYAGASRDVRPAVAWDRVTVLGHHNRFIYVTLDSDEYQVSPRELATVDEFGVGPDTITFKRPVAESVGGSPVTREARLRGVKVPAGTYVGLVEAAEAKAAAAVASRAPRSVDTLTHPLLRPTPDRIVELRGPTLTGVAKQDIALELDTYEAVARREARIREGRPDALLIAGKPPVRGPRARLAALEGKGIRCSLTAGGRLLVEAPRGRLEAGVLDVVRDAERLLIGVLSGHPLKCELPHDGKPPEASTFVAVGIAACGDH